MKRSHLAKLICLFLLCNIKSSSYAQLEKLRFEHYSLKNGLRFTNVTNLLQDRKGYLWFGTYDGLNKYDGYNFVTYKHTQDTTSLIQNSIFSLWEDKDGMIWIGTADAGISKFDRTTGKFTQYRPEPDSTTFVHPLRAVSAMNEDSEGFMWVANFLGDLRRFDKRTGKFFSHKYDLDSRKKSDTINQRNNIYCIYKDHTGVLWIGDDDGLHKMNITPGIRNQPSKISFTHYRHDPGNPNSVSHNSVTCIFEDHKGILWIATGGFITEGKGLNRLNPKTGVFTQYLHDPTNPQSISNNSMLPGQSIAEDTAGNLWIGTFNGLNKLNRDRTQFTRYLNDPNDPESLGGNFISSVLIDRSGILWAGVGGAGLEKLDPHQKPFRLYRHNPFNEHSLNNDSVNSLTGDGEGVLWIGTSGGLNALNEKTGAFKHYRHDPDKPGSVGNAVFFVTEDKDSDGNMWIFGQQGLSLFNSKTGNFIYSPDSVHFKTIYKDGIGIIYEDRQGLLWFGAGDNGLKSFDRKTGEVIHYRHDPKNFQGLADHAIWSINEDKRGNLWLGHGSVGLSKLNKRTGIFTHYLPNPHDSTSLSTSIVNSIFEDSKGNLWFGTQGGGLCHFNQEKETFTTYTEKEGLADNTILSIQEDTESNLWLGTTKGISKFSPVTHTFTNYDSADGLPGTIYSAACFSGKDGTLYYGSLNGLTAFDPRDLKPNPYIPPVVITQFKLFDKPVLGKNESEEIILNHNENFFSFEFSALNYTNSSRNKYAYQLVGVDKDWVYSNTRRLASYTNIGPGKYTFKVKGSNNDGVWNEEGISIKVIIRPPWWRTWWAYTFYGLCFIAGIFLIDRYRKKRVINKERDRARERELEQAHEIEKAYHTLKTTQAQLIQSEKMASLGELTAGIAHEIQNPLNFVNNFSEINKELLVEMKDELDKGNLDDAKTLANNAIDNQEKINHHGKRADAIVKGMLLHSRSSSGQRELTDINALADEYLRLAYHGLRAKDKSFNATLKTEYDQTIGNINIIPQDLGRVILNLITNAFYAVNEKASMAKGSGDENLSAGQAGYEPTVTVSTKRIEDRVEIKVSDNGNGIPSKVVDKIFQPFFTTKPAGQGTGLGLSMSYDIITNAHGGELKIETKEGEGATFIITLIV